MQGFTNSSRTAKRLVVLLIWTAIKCEILRRALSAVVLHFNSSNFNSSQFRSKKAQGYPTRLLRWEWECQTSFECFSASSEKILALTKHMGRGTFSLLGALAKPSFEYFFKSLHNKASFSLFTFFYLIPHQYRMAMEVVICYST